jgi:multicomponent Na+:H+ antiporter subunit D
MLAYVLIAEVGYIALGIGLANKNALTGAILHIQNDALMMGSLFLVAGVLASKTGFRKIYQFKNIHKKMPITMAIFVVSALSVIGIPPTCGFFSKWYLLGAIDEHQWFFVVVCPPVASSMPSFFRVIEIVYFSLLRFQQDGLWSRNDEAPLSASL